MTIGDDVWVGGGVLILPGVTIGNKCVIGSGSVVTKNILNKSKRGGDEDMRRRGWRGCFRRGSREQGYGRILFFSVLLSFLLYLIFHFDWPKIYLIILLLLEFLLV